MSYKALYPLKGDRNIGVALLQGSFCPNGSGAIDNGTNTGAGFTVARTGVGEFTVTLDDAYVSLLSAQVSVQLAASAVTLVQFGVIDLSAKTLIINVIGSSGGSPGAADIDANANNKIHFALFLKDSSVTP